LVSVDAVTVKGDDDVLRFEAEPFHGENRTFQSLLRKLHIRPVWSPPEASWLNLIEAHVGVPKRFTLGNTDDLDHIIRRRRIYRYLRYRHRNLGLRHPLNRIRMIRPVKLEEH
jgi:hypothetical protein